MTLPLDIAKALLPTIKRSHKASRYGLDNILHVPHAPTGEWDGSQYVATDGHVAIIIDTTTPAPTTEPTHYEHACVMTTVATKGRVPAPWVPGSGGFLGWQRCIPTTSTPTAAIGVDLALLDAALKVHKALKLSEKAYWTATFSDALGPIVLEPMSIKHDTITRVRVVIMPVRIS
tara:strand:- start:215 stop:739 length:525 start_codon:yes stop_codon:yes gene_type:complete